MLVVPTEARIKSDFSPPVEARPCRGPEGSTCVDNGIIMVVTQLLLQVTTSSASEKPATGGSPGGRHELAFGSSQFFAYPSQQ